MIGIILLFLISDTLKINLEQAKEMALESNPAYRMEALSGRYNKLGFYESLTSNILNPTVGITYSDATYEEWPYISAKGYNFNLSLNQPVFDLREVASIMQSKSSLNASGASLEEAKNALYYQVEAQYLAVLKVENLLRMQQKAIERAKENMRFVTKRLELGQASKLDLLNAEVYLNRTKLNLFTVRRDFQITKRILLNTLGIERQCELLLGPVETEKEEFEIPELDTLIKIGFKNRPRIKAAQEKIKEIQLGFWGSLCSFLPRVSFRWLWNYNSEEFPDKFSTIKEGARKSSGWYVTANLNLFSYPFEVSKMKTILEETELNLLHERLLVIKEIKEAWLDCLTMDENLELAKSMFEAAKEGNTLAKTQYNLGLITTLDLFQVETDLLDAEATYVSVLYDIRLTKAKLRYVIGG